MMMIIIIIITVMIVLIEIMMIRRGKRIIINETEKETCKVKMGSWSSKLLSKNITTLGKKT